MRTATILCFLALFGCSSEVDSSDAELASTEAELQGSIKLPYPASNCTTVTGNVGTSSAGTSGSNMIFSTTNFAVVACPIFNLSPYDTLSLSRMTYRYSSPTTTENLMCTLEALTGSTVTLRSPWASGSRSAPRDFTIGGSVDWYYSAPGVWVQPGNPTDVSYRLFCRIPLGVQFVRYEITYQDLR